MPKDRCPWCGELPIYVEYHDAEWGVPVHEDRHFFEMLILEGAQAGLSWLTVLKKRAAYRAAYRNFEPEIVAGFGEAEAAALRENAGLIRNRAKIAASIANAHGFLEIQEEFGSFDAYVWRFVEGVPRQNARSSMREIPPTTPESDALSRDLKQRGFRFVGSTIIYAFMQATGLVNDHLVGCFRQRELLTAGK